MKRTLLALLAASTLLTSILVARAERIDTAPLPAGTVASRVFIDKSERTLTLFRHERELKTYKVALGRNPVGHKQQEGDGRTPEGRYTITFHKKNSSFHRALRISYPNAEDVRSARELGVPPGGDIMIHGLPNGMGSLGANHLLRDWTEGCIAVTNEEIEEIWRAVPDGTVVEITP